MESLQKYVIDHHQKTIAECSNEELYIALLNYTKQASAQKKLNTGKKNNLSPYLIKTQGDT